jgi:glycine/D-amino acid oxidase-like deaminating enzyme
MQRDDSLRGVSVLIAGAGLAGLVAARELQRYGAADRRSACAGQYSAVVQPPTPSQPSLLRTRA